MKLGLDFNEIEKLPKINKYMMATTAIHKLGDISSSVPDLCHVKYESETDYYGSWVEGFGFFNVRFPKETTRELTEEEIAKYDKMCLYISGNPIGRIRITE